MVDYNRIFCRSVFTVGDYLALSAHEALPEDALLRLRNVLL